MFLTPSAKQRVPPGTPASATCSGAAGRGDLRASTRCRLASLLLAIALVGCGNARTPGRALAPEPEPGPPAQLPLGKPFFLPGEAMVFDIALRNVAGARAVIVVGEPGTMDGRRVLIVRTLVESAGVARWLQQVRNEVQTRLDLDSGVAVAHRDDFARGNAQASAVIEFAPGAAGVSIEHQHGDKPPARTRKTMPEGQQMHDFHSALGLLRAWQARPGDKLYYYSVRVKRFSRTELQYVGSETVRTAMGLYPALRFEGVSLPLSHALEVDAAKPSQSFTFWFSDDHLRMPLRLTAHTEHGELVAELVEYRGPERHLSRH